MQIGKTRHLKTCEDFAKIKNEDPRGLRRHYRGRNFVLKSQDNLYRSKQPKGRRNKDLSLRAHSHAPRAWGRHLESAFSGLSFAPSFDIIKNLEALYNCFNKVRQ